MAGATLTVDDDGVARLHLDDPERGNAIGPPTAEALRAHAADLRDRDDVRVVVLSAGGPAFCVGGDIRHFASTDGPGEAMRALVGDFHAALIDLAALDAPVVARVQGVAAGGGLSLMCAADLAVAASSARFTAAYTRIGLSPDGGLSWWLPRMVGHRTAADLMLTNRQVGAAEALEMGLVSEVADDAALDARVEELAAALAAGAAPAQAAVKRLLNASSTSTYEDQLEREAERIAALAASPSGREGVAAFVARRAPDFAAAPGRLSQSTKARERRDSGPAERT